MIVRYFASEWCTNSLFQKEKIYRKGSFSLSSTVSSCTTKPPSSPFWVDNAVGKMLFAWFWFSGGELTGQVSQSGKPLCTGASLWAVPKLARGLRPLEPRHVNCVSFPQKCSLDISAEYLLIDWDSSPLPLRSAQSWRPLDVMRPAPAKGEYCISPYGIPCWYCRAKCYGWRILKQNNERRKEKERWENGIIQ